MIYRNKKGSFELDVIKNRELQLDEFKNWEVQLEEYKYNYLICKDNLYKYIKSNLELDTIYCLVLKCNGIEGEIIFRSNVLYSFTSENANIDYITDLIEGLIPDYCTVIVYFVPIDNYRNLKFI
jgi:hypothetical protein